MRTSLKDEVASYLGCYLLFELKRIIFVNTIDNIFQITLFYWLKEVLIFCHAFLGFSVKFWWFLIIVQSSEVPLVTRRSYHQIKNWFPYVSKILSPQMTSQLAKISKFLKMHHLCCLISWLLLMLGKRSLYHLEDVIILPTIYHSKAVLYSKQTEMFSLQD